MGFSASQARLSSLIWQNEQSDIERPFIGQARLSTANVRYQDLRKNILHWLLPLDNKSFDFHWSDVAVQQEHLWVLQSKEFLDWREQGNALLHIHGGPASGKTILSAAIINRMEDFCRSNTSSALAFHYFQTKSRLCDRQRPFLRSLLRQLASHLAFMPADLFRHKEQSGQQSEIKKEELLPILHTIIEHLEHAYIIIDGIDECEERDDVLATIKSIHEWGSQRVHMLVTCRTEGYCNENFEKGKVLHITQYRKVLNPRDWLHSALRIDQRQERYKSAAQEKPNPTEKGGYNDLFVSSKIVAKLNSSGRPASPSVRASSQSSTVAYDQILKTVRGEARSDFRNILHFLAFAVRPLSASEISGMLAVDLTADLINKTEGPQADLWYLLKLCDPVIHGSQQDTTLNQESRYLAEGSFSAYLSSAQILDGPLKDYAISEREGHLKIANICIAYLSQFKTEDVFHSFDISQFPFARYAAQNWWAHAWASQKDHSGGLSNKILKQKATYLNAIRLYDPEWPSAEPALSRPTNAIPALLYYLSLAGLEEYVRIIMGRRDDNESAAGLFGSALQAAAAGGHDTIVQLLLDSGLDVNAQGGCYGNPLCAAASVGNDTVVKTLLSAGADLELIGGNNGRLLYQREANEWTGEDNVARASKSFNNIGPIDNALFMATYEGNTGVVKTLIGAGAEIDAKDSTQGRTPLIWATIRNMPHIVEILLVAGADPNLADSQGYTALQIALEHHFDDITESLLRRNAEASENVLEAVFKASMKVNPASYVKDKGLTRRLKGKGAHASAVEVLLRVSGEEGEKERILRKCFSLQGESVQRLRRNILRERDVLQTLTHPNVVQFLGYRENKSRKTAYLYMEYCDGGDLTQFISEAADPGTSMDQSTISSHGGNNGDASYESDASSDSAPAPQQRRVVIQLLAWSMLEQTAAALAYCHHGVVKDGAQYRLKHIWRQVLHRDIKPANLVLSNENNAEVAKLCDLGLVRVRDDLEKQTLGLGTLDFMPPEVKYEMRPWTTKGDCFSLGVIRHADAAAATFTSMAKEFEDSEWEKVLAACLQPLPQDRPSSLMILQSAREALARFQGNPLAPLPFLNNQNTEKCYIQQATFELLERFFRTFKRTRAQERRKLAARIQWLQEDTRDIDQHGWTHLDSIFLAVLGQNKKVLGVLLAQQSRDTDDGCSWDTRGLTPLHICTSESDFEITHLLLEHHQSQPAGRDWLDPHTKDQDGETAAHLAAAYGSSQILRAILDVSADLANVEDSRCQTPLHVAAASGHLAAVQVLIAAGADVGRRDAAGMSVEALSADAGHAEIVKLVQTSGWGDLEVRIEKLREADEALQMQSRRIDAQYQAVAPEIESVQDTIARNIKASFRMMG